MYAILGISGQVGGATARTLLAKGAKVRGIVRDPEKARGLARDGVELSRADAGDAAALEAALKGVEGAFVMIPPYFAPAPGFPEARAVIASIRRALATARPPKVVYLSSIGAQHDHGVGLITTLHILEREMGTLPIPGAFLRPAWFMENSVWDVASARDQGEIASYLQPLDRKFPMIATADIGRAAAETLLENWSGRRTIELEGPERYSPNDSAAAFAKLLGRAVRAKIVERSQWEAQFESQGTPRERNEPRIEMLDGFNSGWIEFAREGTEYRKGVVTLEEGLRTLVEPKSLERPASA
jgi:NAD(P)H dehydrogenase (quinone)